MDVSRVGLSVHEGDVGHDVEHMGSPCGRAHVNEIRAMLHEKLRKLALQFDAIAAFIVAYAEDIPFMPVHENSDRVVLSAELAGFVQDICGEAAEALDILRTVLIGTLAIPISRDEISSDMVRPHIYFYTVEPCEFGPVCGVRPFFDLLFNLLGGPGRWRKSVHTLVGTLLRVG